MRNLFIIILFLIILFLNGCNRLTKKDYAEFQSVKTIHLNEHSIPSILGMPADMVVQNDLVIVLDQQADRFFYIFSKERFNFLGNAVRRGRGPKEEIFIAPYFRNYENDKILYQSNDAVKIANIELSSDGLDIVVVDQYDLPELSLMDTDFFKINDYLFSSMSTSPRPASKDYFVICTQTGETFEWGELIPLTEKNVNSNLLPMVKQKLTTVNLEDKLIASVFHMLPILRIYCFETEKLLTELQMTDASENEKILLKDPNLKRGDELINYYYRIKSTSDFIYALYAGISVSEYYKEGEMPQYTDFSDEIHIWKWDGTPVMKLELDRPVFSFDVTHDNKRIVASSVDDVDKLFEAEIPWD